MTRTRIAYMPLSTYPEAVTEGAILAAADFAASLHHTLHVTVFTVDIPQVSSAFGSLLLDIPGLVRTAEDKSKAECRRLQGLFQEAAGVRFNVQCTNREVILGATLDAAVAEARYFDLAVLPWSDTTVTAQDMMQAVVFGAGRPTILVPPSARPAPLEHIAIAWDASPVAARALGDALPLLAEGGRVSVLTVADEKPLAGPDIAAALSSSLAKRGFIAAPVKVTLGAGSIAEALQDAALSEGAQLLAMGGFGHSRIRDFVLGGATRGVLADLRLPALLSH